MAELVKDIKNDVPNQSENALQQKCVFWFHNEFPSLRGLLFAVPNGGLRSGASAKTMHLTGVVKGVSDLILLYKSEAFLIELKSSTGTQKKEQKNWQDKVEIQGFEYFIVRSLEDFKKLIHSIV